MNECNDKKNTVFLYYKTYKKSIELVQSAATNHCSQNDAISNLSPYIGPRATALQALRTQAKATEISLA